MVGGADGYIRRDDSHLDYVGDNGNGESGYNKYTSILYVELIGPDILYWGKKEGSIKDDVQFSDMNNCEDGDDKGWERW